MSRTPIIRGAVIAAIGIAAFLSLPPTVAQGLSPPHDASNGIGCEDCHSGHGGGMFGGLIPRGAEQEALCKSCHNPTGQASTMVDVGNHEVGAGTLTIDCGSCHEVHGPYQTTDPHTGQTADNLKLVRGDTAKYLPAAQEPAIFQQRPDHFSFDTGPFTGICQSCHTSTNYHANDGTDPHHNLGSVCTTCHLHESGFAPGGCTGCHDQAQGPRRQVSAAGGDFERASHHVRGTVEDGDCITCHYVREHGSQTVKLLDPDQGGGLIHSFDPNAPEALEGYCLACHDSDGASASGGLQPFSDGVTVPDVDGVAGNSWADSAHKQVGYAQNGGNPVSCLGDGSTSGCHGNAHGSDNEKILSADPGLQSIDQLCFNCHTDGKIVNDAISNNRTGGHFSADDIEEAFGKSTKHDIGATFTVGNNTYTLQCTSCHNPHVVTGKYWEADLGVSPVTRPDLNADPTTNPRAMGSTLWGAAAGEKMDDFAARGSGSGGWYFSTARGGTIAIDQPAVYRPPRDGASSQSEFPGDVLPDYTTLCLDCHSHRMSAANPPVNWGQGISCTDNSVDPPSQRVECGADHGLGRAGKPSYVSDSGKSGFWGRSGNPDVLFQMNYVTRGRHNGHFMRWPYDSAERSAGINFVLSCTDCHEAHGSNRGGIIRERFNVNANGDCGTGGDASPNGENCGDGGNWGSYCNACHYSYGGQHMRMGCGNASCHEANSIHRIIHTVDSGAGSQLMLTAAGYEGSYQKPDFTPELETVSGHIGSQQLAVTFKQGQDGIGIYTREDLSGALAPDDFWLFDVDGDNPKAVTGVVHTAGAYAATLILDTPLTAADLGRDILAVRPRTIWDWYAGGYQNAATGTIGAQAVSAGPWPAVVTGPAPVGLVKTAYAGSQIRVFFNEAVYGTGAGGAIQSSDLVLSNCAGRAIVSIDHLAGDSTATLTLDSPLTLGDLGACSVAAAAASVSDAYGNHAGSTSVALSLSDECPIGATSFQFDEAAGSPYAFDEQYRYVGTVSNPATSLPGDGLFHGDENQATPTVIDFDNSLACLKEANTITVEALLRTDDVDLDYDGPSDLTPGDQDATRNATFSRVFERKRTIKITIMRADYAGDNVDSRAGRARVEVKYFVDAASRHSCPHPQWPDDTYQGNDSRWHQVSTDIDAYPLLSDHWYKIRVVFNSAKTRIPIDIWVDDLGTDDPAVNPDVGEWWPGFINIAMPDPQDSSSCRWGALPGDVIALEDQASHVGAPPGHTSAYVMKGQIDWISWKPEADYTGVDDGPHY